MSHHQNMKMQCQNYLHQPVQLQVGGQHGYSGIIEHVDDHNVYVMVPVDETGQYMDLAQLMQGTDVQSMYPSGQEYDHAYAQHSQDPLARQERNERYYPEGFYSPYPYYYPYYPYPYGPYTRPLGWNRLILPLAALTAIATLV
jgi:hypothetical protein